MHSYKQLMLIKNDQLKAAIRAKYCEDLPYTLQIHQEIKDSISLSRTSLRQLEEITYHLYYCRDYFQLKETVSEI